jgi:hypothetical protein
VHGCGNLLYARSSESAARNGQWLGNTNNAGAYTSVEAKRIIVADSGISSVENPLPRPVK